MSEPVYDPAHAEFMRNLQATVSPALVGAEPEGCPDCGKHIQMRYGYPEHVWCDCGCRERSVIEALYDGKGAP